MDENDPYAEGADAFIGGASITENPYPDGSDDHLSWNDGWQSQCDAELEEDE